MELSKVTDWCKNQMRLNVTHEDVQLMVSDQTVIKNDTLAREYLKHQVKRLMTIKFGKELDYETTKIFIGEILKKCGNLSCQEVNVNFEKIIDGKTEVSNYFNISEIMKVLSYYQSCKTKVRNKYFELMKHLKEDDESLQKRAVYLSKCLSKKQKNEILNVYEKSMIGKHFEDRCSFSSEIHERTEIELPKKQKELNSIQESRIQSSDNVFGAFKPFDETGDEPIMWTFELLYGFNLFNNLIENKAI